MQELTLTQLVFVNGGQSQSDDIEKVEAEKNKQAQSMGDDASGGGWGGFAWATFRAIGSPLSGLFYSSKLGNGEMPPIDESQP